MASIFLSYSSQDKAVASKIARDLEKHGIIVWLDTNELLPGDNLSDKISQGIANSDYLLVILSKNSVNSDWVKSEVSQAYQRDLDASSKRIIPVRVDNSEVPFNLASVVYVDMRENYERGIDQIVSSTNVRLAETVPGLGKLVDADDVVEHVENEQKGFRGAGYIVTTFLGFATIVVALIATIPSFYSAFGQQARIYFSVQEQQIDFPPDVDSTLITALLKDNGIPDATVRIDVINQGGAPAKNVKIGVIAPGPIVRAYTDPTHKPQPVWVNISTTFDPKNTPRHINYNYSNLVAGKVVKGILSYNTEPAQEPISIDVVADGASALQVENIRNVPAWEPWRAFELPLMILGWGFAFTFLIGLIAVLIFNPASRKAILFVVMELNPTLARIIDVVAKIT